MISIIIPVYNADEYIDECIKSVTEQTYSDFELLLIDDGSTDTSSDICKNWECKDSRIKYLFQNNSGVSVARNHGIEQARGEFITFIDSDDFVDCRYCEKLLSHMDDAVDIVVLGLDSFYNNSFSLIRHRLPVGMYANTQLREFVIDDGTMSGFTIHSACGVLYRRKLIERYNLRFNSKVRFNEDGLFNCEYVFIAQNAAWIDYSDVIYHYRKNLASASLVANPFEDGYRKCMSEIETVLLTYATDDLDREVSKQLGRRCVSNTLTCLQYLAHHDVQDYSMRQLICGEQFRQGLQVIDFKKLSMPKQVAYVLMRFRCARILNILLRIK